MLYPFAISSHEKSYKYTSTLSLSLSLSLMALVAAMSCLTLISSFQGAQGVEIAYVACETHGMREFALVQFQLLTLLQCDRTALARSELTVLGKTS